VLLRRVCSVSAQSSRTHICRAPPDDRGTSRLCTSPSTPSRSGRRGRQMTPCPSSTPYTHPHTPTWPSGVRPRASSWLPVLAPAGGRRAYLGIEELDEQVAAEGGGHECLDRHRAVLSAGGGGVGQAVHVVETGARHVAGDRAAH
jgi:hypothetical protein